MIAPTPAPVLAPLVTTPHIVPAPASMTVGGGAPFVLTAATSIVVAPGSADAAPGAEALGTLLRPATGFPVLVLAAGFQSSLNVVVSSEDGESDATARSLRHHSTLAAAAILGNLVVGPLLLVLYGPSFYPAILPMLILLPGMWFLGTGQVITGDLRGRNRPGVSSALAGAAMVATIALDFALIPPFGVTGAAVASLCSYTFFGIASLFVLSRLTGLSLRTLAVPTRADLALYPAALRSLRARLRRSPAASRP